MQSPIESRYRCLDCGVGSPPTDEETTLLSTRHGWRFTRHPERAFELVARCPACWAVHRGRAKG